jgi:cytochrome c oxidase cbb3-type subunit 3
MKALVAKDGSTGCSARAWRCCLSLATLALAGLVATGTAADAQPSSAVNQKPAETGAAGAAPGGVTAEDLQNVPAVELSIGGVRKVPSIQNPVGDDPEARQRGMEYFIQFNCVGCHMPNGGGGMGPSLSDVKWIYGSEPAQVFLTIAHGRPAGMPSWGGRLPDSVIWDLVAYVRGISKTPAAPWGKTVSVANF